MKTMIMICSVVLLLSVFTGIAVGGTEGATNTFYGAGAGMSIAVDKGYDTFIGGASGSVNTTGRDNTFLGFYAGFHNTTASYNTFLGESAGYANTTGGYNTFLGYAAGASNKTGGNNTFLGIYAGYSNTTGNNNVFLGYRAGQSETGSNRLYIANSNTSTPLICGEFDNKVLALNGKVGIGKKPTTYPLEMASGAYVTTAGVWTDASSREYKDDIEVLGAEEAFDALKELNPVTFAYKSDRTEKHVGFIAEEVPELVATKDRKGLSPMDIVAVLTKVVQEQQRTIADLSDKVNTLERTLKEKGE